MILELGVVIAVSGIVLLIIIVLTTACYVSRR